jgi:hypothetical protein
VNLEKNVSMEIALIKSKRTNASLSPVVRDSDVIKENVFGSTDKQKNNTAPLMRISKNTLAL